MTGSSRSVHRVARCARRGRASRLNMIVSAGPSCSRHFGGRIHVLTALGRSGGVRNLLAVKVIGRALRLSTRRKDRALVVFQHLEPGADVGGVVFAILKT